MQLERPIEMKMSMLEHEVSAEISDGTVVLGQQEEHETGIGRRLTYHDRSTWAGSGTYELHYTLPSLHLIAMFQVSALV